MPTQSSPAPAHESRSHITLSRQLRRGLRQRSDQQMFSPPEHPCASLRPMRPRRCRARAHMPGDDEGWPARGWRRDVRSSPLPHTGGVSGAGLSAPTEPPSPLHSASRPTDVVPERDHEKDLTDHAFLAPTVRGHGAESGRRNPYGVLLFSPHPRPVAVASGNHA